MPDIAFDYLALRHGTSARWLRAGLSRWLAGRDGWPLVFRAPSADAGVPQGGESQSLCEEDFGLLLRTLCAAGLARRDDAGWIITESGAIWVHRLQTLFSLTYIDDLWSHCQDHPWPQEIMLA